MMYWDGGGWAWMTFMPILWIVLVGLLVWALVRLTHPLGRGTGGAPPGTPGRETPEEILDRRFAAGEIDADAYARAHEQLAAHRGKTR
ncbi:MULTISPECIES: SHOCT domain-containing protein [unclassified Streptomyces]|uniref:SHOCT domain-containing protein n=1 Tax=unclassified Streptomyces TaxID=2593676 RepID=UPI001F03A524|nr:MULTISPECIES: SHOCT domain-containing protein [unclassified Streptomyces]MCH0563148.1 hypothetical protein [Streptomyces sp. MUM 2J]MCH0568577.1 hypothetical protein [Streptomyces sp. MUM 136J]